ncbi:MAG: hypothetical protein KY451_03415 [Actinobacteria bacterium]|nr:hypothetical protein [Actinomycetota bacterium]
MLVVHLGVTCRKQLGSTLGSLRKLGVPLLGLAANGSVASRDPAYTYGYYGANDKAGHSRKRSPR